MPPSPSAPNDGPPKTANPLGIRSQATPPTATSTATTSSRSRNRRTGTTRQRLGCLTCRHRRKKCDEIYPICGHCRRLNLVCKREEPRKLVPESVSSSDEEGCAGLVPKPLVRRFSNTFPAIKAADTIKLERFIDPSMGNDTRLMLSYYTEVLAGLLTTSHDNNSFLSVFLPMAIDSIALQKSLVAWSSAHLSGYSKPHLLVALENRSSALLMVAAALSNPMPSLAESETVLAACLVLCSTEIAFGDTCHWYQHLLGAQQIILAARRPRTGGGVLSGPSALMQSRDGPWLLRNFAYHDVLGAVTSLDPPLIRGSYWISDDSVTLVDSYVGFGSAVLAMLSEVCALDIMATDLDWNQARDLPLSSPCFWHTTADIENRLQKWTCPESSDFPLMELAEAYRSASLVVLYRKQRTYCQNHMSVSSAALQAAIAGKMVLAVDATMHHISLVPMQALSECGLLFPLFIAGGDTLNSEHIETVRARLTVMKEHRGFGNLAKAGEVLEELWRCRVSGYRAEYGMLDWLDILAGRGWKLTLC